jgi:hypothetical protein
MAIEVQTAETIAQLVAKGAEAPVNAEPAPVVAPVETVDTSTEGTKVETTDETAGEKPRKNPVQKRIDELVRKGKENEEFARDEYNRRVLAERRAQELEERLSKLQPQTVVEEKKMPTPADFKNVEEYVDALTDWKLEAKEKQKETERQKQQAQAEHNARIERWQERQEAARAEIEDYDEIVGKADVPIRQYLQDALIESEYGPWLAVHFAKHPTELERLNKLSPASAIRELGKLETKFEKQSEKSESTTTVETPKKTASSPVSRAPAPIEPIRSTVSDVSKNPAALSFDDYRAMRKAGKIK